MNGFEIAAIIVAVALTIFIIYLALNLKKISNIFEQLKHTVVQANASIEIITKDVDRLSIEVEGLLNKANDLVDDVNGKLSKTDPLFTAIGDLGLTVSDVNESTHNLVAKVTGTDKRKKSSTLMKVGKSLFSSKPKESEPLNQEPIIEVVDNLVETPIEIPIEETVETPVEIPVETPVSIPTETIVYTEIKNQK
ncbi:DUF948 domain-containing protein [Granulicatella seriolae]|uniref:DUF948 domain-containing protein n=1 Tax=Granulicatella seriolae TaxID=2967226 RepID=A0ABT1WNI3_9LACT|nr:DUF948 domain-containing protein [Granulicatella seriolae]